MSDEEKLPENKILSHSRSFQTSIGIFILLILVLYFFFNAYSLLTKKNVTAYEVTLGSIVEKNFYQGLALRKEEVVLSDKSGYIYYYSAGKSRVGARSRVYAIDSAGDVIGKLHNTNNALRKLGSDELSGIVPDVESFLGGFDGASFNSIYTFKGEVEDYLREVLLKDLEIDYAADIAGAKERGEFFDYYAKEPGIVVYSLDGFEDKNLESLSFEDFNAGALSLNNLRTRDSLSAGDPVYKLVLSDDWQIVIPIDAAKAADLSELINIKIRFTQDNAKTWAGSEVITIDNNKYLVLSLDDSMERYANQRFINVELLLDEKKGLKIPNTALTEKEFYVVPKSYFMTGGNSREEGILIRSAQNGDQFIVPTIYYDSGDHYYIDNEFVSAGDKLVKENSRSTYTIGTDVAMLTGVYNINKGYTVFKHVEKVYQNNDYAIVKSGVAYSLSLYDHIVLDASIVKENEIL